MIITNSSIRIDSNTRNELRQYGRKAQTYNDIVKELLKKAKESSNVAPLDDYKRRK